MIHNKLPDLLRKILSYFLIFIELTAFLTAFLLYSPSLIAGQIKANVNVIIDKLPLDKQQKLKDFHTNVKNYIENVDWLEEADVLPIEISLQMFLTDIPSNIEDRYKCEFLISSSDVQYFDKRVRFPYQPGDPLVYNEQTIEPLTGVIDFYINIILGNELDKESFLGGDIYYKRALNIAALGKFVRTEFIIGWTEREELIQRVFEEPFLTFRKMKDFYFYALYIRKENIAEARKHLKTALNMIETVMKKQSNLEEPKQFLNAHYLDLLEIFKDDSEKSEVFKKLKELDPEHKELYEEHISD
ncbi:MAG: DUF4835 family protein [bacterium]